MNVISKLYDWADDLESRYVVFLAARVLMALMFIESFIDKSLNWDFYLNEIIGWACLCLS